MELFNSSQFSSKNNDALRDFELDVSSKKKAVKRTQPKLDPAWDDGSAFPEVSSIASSVCDKEKNIFLEEKRKDFKVGDTCGTRVRERFEIIAHKKYSGEKGYLSGYHTNDRQQFWVKLDNYDLQIRVFPNQVKSSEGGAIAPCQNSHNLTSAQGLAQDSPLPPQNLEDLSLSEPQRLTTTAATSLLSDTQECITTETCEESQDLQHESLAITCTLEESTSLQRVPHVPPSQQKVNDLEPTMSGIVSPPSSQLLENCNPSLLQLKTSQVCSTAPTAQEMSAVTSGTFFAHFPPAGTMRNGLLWELDTLEVPLLEKEYCWLPSPGALSSTGKGRPPGQTKQEGELKRLGLLEKNEVLNPAILCQWYEIPESWLDPSESRAATELLENNERQQEICLTPELPASPSVESFISTQSDIKLLSTQEIIEALSISEDELDEFWNNEPALFKGFKIQWLGATIQKWRLEPNTFLKDKLPQSESIPEKFLEDKKQSPSIESLSLSSVESNTTPENFLEESTADTKQLPSPKRRQRKGCLYKYLENKKLKNGNIASYPRVIGETRDPDNPKHWRWGFNWEEKIDGEWKGRSIGSVPIGAIALIQSMQKESVSLEEIIGFIRRSKNKG